MLKRKYEVLGDKARYELWADDLEHARARVMAEMGEIDCVAFVYGACPRHMDLSNYRQCQELYRENPDGFGLALFVQSADQVLADMLEGKDDHD